jgi:hypothetical protein
VNNAQTAAAFLAGQQLLQSVNGENITIAGLSYVCLPANLISTNRLWEAGGAAEEQSLIVSVLKTDLPAAPATNTAANFRGLDWRTTAWDDADTFWEIHLSQETA